MRKSTISLAIALAFTGGTLASVLYNAQSAEAKTDVAPAANAPCASIASEDAARTLLTRLFPNAQIITAENLSIDDMKSSCLLEVEMLADANKPETRGFVYVLPDGERFLNGPLMDKRSKVALEPISAEISKALMEQQEALKSLMIPRMEQSATTPALVTPSNEADYSSQLAGSFPEAASTAEVPTAEQMRQKLVEKMQALPSLITGSGEKTVHVLVDPLCGHCKKLYQISEELTAKHGIRFNWIPMFLNEASWAMSSIVLKEAVNSPERATALLSTMMQGKWGGSAAEASVRALTEEDYAAVKPAAGLFIELAKSNSRIGTPLVVFETATGDIEVISGVPTEDDWKSL